MLKPIFFNPFYKPGDTILVVGSGRSGTTWLGNIIGSCQGFLSLFEPFDYRHVPQINTSSLRLYIKHDESSHYLDKTIENIFSGKIRNDWILSQNTRKLTWRILIKEIRANLFLGYVKNRFGNPIVFITRHPCATVLSRLESKWETHLDTFLKQTELMEDYLHPFDNLINNAKNDLEKHTIMWCVENLVPLKQLIKEQFVFCAYEYLVIKTNEEVNRIFDMLGLRVPSGINETISKPTTVSSNRNKLTCEENMLRYWKAKLRKDEIRSILDIVNSFGIDIYGDDYMPDLNCRVLA